MPDKHEVKPGDCILSIADAKGFFWETLWEHPENTELRERRQDPNTLLQGDTVFVPDKRPKKITCPATRKHCFLKKGIPARLPIQVFDGDEVRSNEEYTIEIKGENYSGITDKEGTINIPVPSGATEGTLYMGPDKDVFEVKIGHLPPANLMTGMKARLKNLGIYHGEINEELDEETREAMADFQERYGLEVTGEPNKETEEKLIQLHDEFGGIVPGTNSP